MRRCSTPFRRRLSPPTTTTERAKRTTTSVHVSFRSVCLLVTGRDGWTDRDPVGIHSLGKTGIINSDISMSDDGPFWLGFWAPMHPHLHSNHTMRCCVDLGACRMTSVPNLVTNCHVSPSQSGIDCSSCALCFPAVVVRMQISSVAKRCSRFTRNPSPEMSSRGKPFGSIQLPSQLRQDLRPCSLPPSRATPS